MPTDGKSIADSLSRVDVSQLSLENADKLCESLTGLADNYAELVTGLREYVRAIKHQMADKRAEAELPPADQRYMFSQYLADLQQPELRAAEFTAIRRRFHSQLVTPAVVRLISEHPGTQRGTNKGPYYGKIPSIYNRKSLSEGLRAQPEFWVKLKLLGVPKNDRQLDSVSLGTLQVAARLHHANAEGQVHE